VNSLQLCSCRPSSATIVGHCHAVVPRTYTRLGDRAFPVAGPRLWQSLLSNLRQSDLTLLQFRWALKMYLFGWLGLQHLVTFVFSVVYKCSYLLTYLLTYLQRFIAWSKSKQHTSWRCMALRAYRSERRGHSGSQRRECHRNTSDVHWAHTSTFGPVHPQTLSPVPWPTAHCS